MNEATRQQAFLGSLAAAATGAAGAPIPALRETGERGRQGMQAYRANADAISDRALASVFATVQAMIGAQDFAHLASQFWRAHPPLRGDLGEWGSAFPAWLEAQPALANWPYLGDCARLDLAIHRNERAADASLDTASLALLASADPARLRLQLMPGSALLRSAWPIASIHGAHQLAGLAAERAFETVRGAIAVPLGESVLVARRNWRAVVHRVDFRCAAWTQDLLDGHSLAAALAAAGPGFDFAEWLATALRESWIEGMVVA